MRRIRDRLRKLYGRPLPAPHRRPVDELVRTILSQHTSDRNRDRAFERLRERFPPAGGAGQARVGEPEVEWAAVRDAPVEEVEEAIRPGGLSRQKAPRIQRALELIGDELDLDWLETAPREEAIGFLCALPGVGRKTAACIQIFTWDIPEIPVDVHVHRVGGRLGLFREKAPLDQAHDEMLAITDPADAYEFHMNLIRHG
ncbi:MAG TPA: DNA lyase, partial [Solirubrobacterales bacterium]|nr:DNA lyase [Solirubrobacterales bacterium]